MARVARDEFRERGDDIDFLHRFLGDPTARGPQHSFRWALLTGAGGEGKTRLAIEFLSRAESRMFRAGFLSQAELKQLDPRRWLPRWASLLVVDYPAQVPAEVAKILDAFSARACESGDEFGFPVRLLLLEREAEGEWFKTIVPSNNRGDNIRNFCFHDDGPKLEHRLKPLARADLIAIMRGRLLRIESLDDDELYSALLRVDFNLSLDGEAFAPRPLFAAATGQAIDDAVASGNTPTDIINTLQRNEVLATIIDRERRQFWSEGEPPYGADERRRQKLHENLLIIATMALNLSRRRFEDECPEGARKYLPNSETLDEERYHRMAGGDPEDMLNRLEPDILGEFFVLDSLKHRDSATRQSLIEAGLQLGAEDAPIFLTRCALDFPDDWNALDRLRPEVDLAAMRTFAKAAFNIAALLSDNRFRDVEIVVSDAVGLSAGRMDQSLDDLAANALFNKGVTLGALGRSEDAIAAYDDLLARFGAATELPLREQVGKALVNKGVRLAALGRSEDAIAAYDDLLARFGAATELPLREQVGKALVNKGATLGALGRSEDAIAAYDDLLARFGAATELPLREIVRITQQIKASMENS